MKSLKKVVGLILFSALSAAAPVLADRYHKNVIMGDWELKLQVDIPRYGLLQTDYPLELSVLCTGGPSLFVDAGFKAFLQVQDQGVLLPSQKGGSDAELFFKGLFQTNIEGDQTVKLYLAAADGEHIFIWELPFTALQEAPEKYVVFEEGTGTWCGWCPRGFVAMEYMEQFPYFIGIAVHNGDVMTNAAYNSANSIFTYPGVNVDRDLRNQQVSNGELKQYYDLKRQTIAPAEIMVETDFDPSTRVLKSKVISKFNVATSGADLRLAAVIVEDSVRGTGSAYNQSNYYSYQSNNQPLNGYGMNWQQEPNPVPFSKMAYNHVGRVLLGGYNGQAGSIPAAVTQGQEVEYTFTHTLPEGYAAKNVKVVGLLVNGSSGVIYNGGHSKYVYKAPPPPSGLSEASLARLHVYPNPVTDGMLWVRGLTESGLDGKAVSFELWNARGQRVEAGRTLAIDGAMLIGLPNGMVPGMYHVRLDAGNQVWGQNFLVH